MRKVQIATSKAIVFWLPSQRQKICSVNSIDMAHSVNSKKEDAHVDNARQKLCFLCLYINTLTDFQKSFTPEGVLQRFSFQWLEMLFECEPEKALKKCFPKYPHVLTRPGTLHGTDHLINKISFACFTCYQIWCFQVHILYIQQCIINSI